VEAPGPVLLVMSEVWYPAGWRAEVNGLPATIHRVNHVLRAVRVDPAAVGSGAVEVDVRFGPISVHRGRVLSIVTLTLVLGMMGIGLWRRRSEHVRPEEVLTEES
jgi:hypothetical protein